MWYYRSGGIFSRRVSKILYPEQRRRERHLEYQGNGDFDRSLGIRFRQIRKIAGPVGNQYRLGRYVQWISTVSYTHLRAHETDSYLVCRLLLEKKKKNNY